MIKKSKTGLNLRKIFKYPWWSRIGILGGLQFLFYYALKKIGFKMTGKLFRIRIKGMDLPFYARFGTSDGAVFNQIFVEQEYACLRDVKDPKLIIDCGANVGYSSLWFLHHYPHASLIGIEPNQENFNLCKKNLSRFGPRVSLIHGAVWPYKTGLTVVQGKDGREWAFQVRECREDEESNLFGVEIEDILKSSGFESIDILKIDIEAAEKMLFSQNYEPWLSKVKNIVIELHGKECEEVFFRALSSYRYFLSLSGELTVCKNISPKVSVLSNFKKSLLLSRNSA